MKQTKWAPLLLVALGLFAATSSAQLIPDPPPPSPARAYLCFEGNGAPEVMRKANEAGARGWRMIGATDSVWCFEQLQAARPSQK